MFARSPFAARPFAASTATIRAYLYAKTLLAARSRAPAAPTASVTASAALQEKNGLTQTATASETAKTLSAVRQTLAESARASTSAKIQLAARSKYGGFGLSSIVAKTAVQVKSKLSQSVAASLSAYAKAALRSLLSLTPFFPPVPRTLPGRVARLRPDTRIIPLPTDKC